jgi:transcriptional regulator with XRE-family HTH domain
MGRPKPTITSVLREAIKESGLTYSELERATGVKRPSIWRFMRGRQTLLLDKADKLAAYLGVTVTRRKQR